MEVNLPNGLSLEVFLTHTHSYNRAHRRSQISKNPEKIQLVHNNDICFGDGFRLYHRVRPILATISHILNHSKQFEFRQYF